IQCRIENARRGCRCLSEELCGGPLKRATARTTYGCTEWQPPVTAIDFNDCTRIFDCDCTCIVTLDGAKCFEGLSFLAAMETLYAAYFCLNMKYNQEVQATLEFIQR
ncbi:uncharacterized protein LOC144123764, partial [Amblyomma americanum]